MNNNNNNTDSKRRRKFTPGLWRLALSMFRLLSLSACSIRWPWGPCEGVLIFHIYIPYLLVKIVEDPLLEFHRTAVDGHMSFLRTNNVTAGNGRESFYVVFTYAVHGRTTFFTY